MQVTLSSYKKDFPNYTVGFNWTLQILNIMLFFFICCDKNVNIELAVAFGLRVFSYQDPERHNWNLQG